MVATNSFQILLNTRNYQFQNNAKPLRQPTCFLYFSYSVFSEKSVYLEIDVTDENDDYYDDYLDEEALGDMRRMDREENHVTVEDVKDVLHGIRSYIRDISHYQVRMTCTRFSTLRFDLTALGSNYGPHHHFQ